jgi:hypothetical protein
VQELLLKDYPLFFFNVTNGRLYTKKDVEGGVYTNIGPLWQHIWRKPSK